MLDELVTKVSKIPLSKGVTYRKALKKQETLQPMKRDIGFEASKETVNSRISTKNQDSLGRRIVEDQEISDDESSLGRLYKRIKLSLWK